MWTSYAKTNFQMLYHQNIEKHNRKKKKRRVKNRERERIKAYNKPLFFHFKFFFLVFFSHFIAIVAFCIDSNWMCVRWQRGGGGAAAATDSAWTGSKTGKSALRLFFFHWSMIVWVYVNVCVHLGINKKKQTISLPQSPSKYEEKKRNITIYRVNYREAETKKRKKNTRKKYRNMGWQLTECGTLNFMQIFLRTSNRLLSSRFSFFCFYIRINSVHFCLILNWGNVCFFSLSVSLSLSLLHNSVCLLLI